MHQRQMPRVASPEWETSVFINCPYDPRYEEIFSAIVFAVYDCRFLPRAALEIDTAAADRVGEIIHLIRSCKYAISDLSRIEADRLTGLPRFNMPFELGLILGLGDCERVHQKRKIVALILVSQSGQHQRFLSDLEGRPARAHQQQAQRAVRLVRNWLNSAARDQWVPSAPKIWRRYEQFKRELPEICADPRLELDPNDLTYPDYVQLVEEWLATHSP